MTPPWTCPFCPLTCDGLLADLSLPGTAPCPLASHRLPLLPAGAAAVHLIDGQPCDLSRASAAAAQLLAASLQPLIAGLGADVATTRALYPLACATGAILDAAGGDALMHGLRALQDRGQFTTTLAEVRTRADLIVFVGGLPGAVAPLIRQRLGIGESQVAQRQVVVLGPVPGDEAQLAGWQTAGVGVECISLSGDLLASLALLAAHLSGRTAVPVPAPLLGLAQRLQTATYSVLIGTPATLPTHGALAVEVVHQIVGQLNQKTRAAALWLGGGNGAATANQVHTWLSGVPLRSRAGPRGLEHEPWLYGSARLLAERAVDSLVWISLFSPSAAPPPTELPLLVLGPPALADVCKRPGSVFIAVATPGMDSAGHVFRTDGTVLMPLFPRHASQLPEAADVLIEIRRNLPLQKAA